MQIVPPERREHEHAHPPELRTKIREQIQARRIGPMQIFHDHDQRRTGRKRRKPFEDRVELLLLRSVRIEDEGSRIETREDIEHRPVRARREFQTLTRPDTAPRVRERPAKFRDQPRLADARIARDQHEAAMRRTRLEPALAQIRQFLVTTDERPA
jgi:hypothetical protein